VQGARSGCDRPLPSGGLSGVVQLASPQPGGSGRLLSQLAGWLVPELAPRCSLMRGSEGYAVFCFGPCQKHKNKRKLKKGKNELIRHLNWPATAWNVDVQFVR